MPIEVELELPEECNDISVRQALAVQLGVEASKLVLSSIPCDAQQRRAKQLVQFEMVGDRSELTALVESLSALGSVKFGEPRAEGPQVMEGEIWEETNGIYYLRQCPKGHLLVNATLELQSCYPCPLGTYLLEGSSDCVKCAEGGDCNGTHFTSRVEGAVWTEEISPDGTGSRMLRLFECPEGHAIIRKQSNPQADLCLECPGSSDFGYSLDAARWNGDKTETGLKDYCKPCPTPATAVKCEGGTKVTSLKDWWLVAQVEEVGKEAGEVDEGADQSRQYVQGKVFVAYQCDPNNCLGNNTCAYGRTGPACSRCPANFALEAGVCEECPDAKPEETRLLRIAFSCVAGAVACSVWFLLSWAPVFGTTAKAIIMTWLAWPLRTFKRVLGLVKHAQKINKSRKAMQGFLTDPNNMKLFQVSCCYLLNYCSDGNYTLYLIYDCLTDMIFHTAIHEDLYCLRASAGQLCHVRKFHKNVLIHTNFQQGALMV